MKDDLTKILNEWPYDSTSVNARVVEGADGLPKIQLRLDLGILQMEAAGRPDGLRPRGAESALDYHLIRAKTTRGTYQLDGDACGELQQEAVQYYYRYLARFNLRDYAGVVTDTQHNIELFNFVAKHVEDDEIAWDFLQFMPYVLMMNARAKAELLAARGERDGAVAETLAGVRRIEEFWKEQGDDDMAGDCFEATTLKELAETIRESKPRGVAESIRDELSYAIRTENFERAAKLRDDLRRMESSATPPLPAPREPVRLKP